MNARHFGTRVSAALLALIVAAVGAVAATAGGQRAQAGPTYKEVGRWGKYGSGNGQFSNNAFGLAVAGNGDVYVADTDNFRIQRFSAGGAFKGKIAFASGDSASDVAIAPDGSVWGTVAKALEARQFGASGGKLASVTTPGQAYGVAVNAAGDVLVASGTKVIRYAKSAGGYAQAQAIGGFSWPYDVEVSPDGSIWVSDQTTLAVKRFDAGGKLLKTIKAGPSAPIGVGIDPDCNAWVTNIAQRRIDRYSPSGKLLGSATAGDLVAQDVAVSSKGDLYAFDGSSRSVVHWALDRSKPAAAAVPGRITAAKGVAKVRYALTGVSCPAEIAATASLKGKGLSGKASVKVAAGKATTLRIPVQARPGTVSATFKIVLKTNGRPTTETRPVTVTVR